MRIVSIFSFQVYLPSDILSLRAHLSLVILRTRMFESVFPWTLTMECSQGRGQRPQKGQGHERSVVGERSRGTDSRRQVGRPLDLPSREVTGDFTRPQTAYILMKFHDPLADPLYIKLSKIFLVLHLLYFSSYSKFY